jgi:hypothetical protein
MHVFAGTKASGMRCQSTGHHTRLVFFNNSKGNMEMKQGSHSGNKPATAPKNDHSKGSKTSPGKGSSGSSSTAGKRGNDDDDVESGRM